MYKKTYTTLHYKLHSTSKEMKQGKKNQIHGICCCLLFKLQLRLGVYGCGVAAESNLHSLHCGRRALSSVSLLASGDLASELKVALAMDDRLLCLYRRQLTGVVLHGQGSAAACRWWWWWW